MTKDYQVTLFCTTGQYKPVSTIVKADTDNISKMGKNVYIKDIQLRGIQKICVQKYWSNRELKMYNYTRVKIREYHKTRLGLL